jgi:hypothetical protein
VHALRDALAEYEPDEVIISTHPETRSGWLRGDLIDRARRIAEPIPVEHVVVDLTEPRERAHVLVLGSQTVAGAPVIEAVTERARRSPAEFTIVVPADPPGAGIAWTARSPSSTPRGSGVGPRRRPGSGRRRDQRGARRARGRIILPRSRRRPPAGCAATSRTDPQETEAPARASSSSRPR